jgi:DNA-binding MarR family transcriptional regulator
MAVSPEKKNIVPFGQQETRVWLQVLSLHGTVFSSLNGVLGAQLGLSVAKFDVLAQLYRYPDGLPLGQLSRNLKVSGGNITGLVQRLLADALITKSISSEDRRSFIVRLTPKGKTLFQKAIAVHEKHLRECFENVSVRELNEALSVLRSLSMKVRDKDVKRSDKQ